MLLTGWSYEQLQELPDGYLGVLIETLEDRRMDQERRNRRL